MPEVVPLNDGISSNDLWIHDETDKTKANIILGFFDTGLTKFIFPGLLE